MVMGLVIVGGGHVGGCGVMGMVLVDGDRFGIVSGDRFGYGGWWPCGWLWDDRVLGDVDMDMDDRVGMDNGCG
ncbi:hypothetical protein RJT34_25036 [Clitoria ternatea]|uniref:Uncharacterized protein n=1 Tax=Clitoria ternatea TaxID=43366 RepID=A0AAN9FP69_CLITE